MSIPKTWRSVRKAAGKYVFAVVRQKGRPTPEVLAEALPKLVEGIKFEKSMTME